MEKILEDVDKEILVELVKLTQAENLKGCYGVWSDFLDLFDRKFGDKLSDPGKRSVDILRDFLRTFSEEEHLKLFSKAKDSWRNCISVQKCIDSAEYDSSEQKLVHLTLKHPAYRKKYRLPSSNEDWMIIPMDKTSKAMGSCPMIAIDCEMVDCENDPQTLVQVCAVDQNLEVKLNMLIKPKDAIIDYRTSITGITSKDLDGIAFSLHDAQESLKMLLKGDTILVGHAMYNDLNALKIDYASLIDTSFIFTFTDRVFRCPSLNNLCKLVLGNGVRKEGEMHDCVDDARAAMKLVLAKLEHGFNDPITLPKKNVPKSRLAKLFLHKIPSCVHRDDLLNLFDGMTGVDIEVNTKVSSEIYTTHALFKDTRCANEAFSNAKGIESKDSQGLCQKLVTLQLNSGESADFYVRKMRERKRR